MSAIGCLLAELFDYAGLFPPTSLDTHSAVRNYLEYGHGPYGRALGRFVVELDRFPYLFDAAGDYVRGMRLSLIAGPDSDWGELKRLLDNGYRIEAIEIKQAAPNEIPSIIKQIPEGVAAYFEVSWSAHSAEMIDAIAAAGARVKVRMGGTKPHDIPSSGAVVNMLTRLAVHRLSFKATAGLHHPLRSRQRMTSGSEGAVVPMHGFVNLACAAALIHLGDNAEEACRLLEEEDPHAWCIADDSIFWRSHRWSVKQLSEVRGRFMISIGSCSFTEPIGDLEALGWL